MKIYQIIAMFIILLSVILIFSSIDNGISTEEGHWSKVEYTDELLVGYPEYYPLVIKLSSLGPLPSDLQQTVNSSEVVKIAYTNIQFNLTGITDVDRNRSRDEWVGAEKPLELKFQITKEMVGDAKILEIIIELQPHNFTDYIQNDVYILYVDFVREGTIQDVLDYSLITIFPVLLLYINIQFYNHVDSKFIENIYWRKIPKFYLIYFRNKFNFLFIFAKKKKKVIGKTDFTRFNQIIKSIIKYSLIIGILFFGYTKGIPSIFDYISDEILSKIDIDFYLNLIYLGVGIISIIVSIYYFFKLSKKLKKNTPEIE